MLPTTNNSPPMPTPPATCNASTEVLAMNIALVVVCPLSVTLCNVLVFHIVTLPVLVETAVSVPAVIEVWFAKLLMVAVVTTCCPLLNMSAA